MDLGKVYQRSKLKLVCKAIKLRCHKPYTKSPSNEDLSTCTSDEPWNVYLRKFLVVVMNECFHMHKHHILHSNERNTRRPIERCSGACTVRMLWSTCVLAWAKPIFASLSCSLQIINTCTSLQGLCSTISTLSVNTFTTQLNRKP